MRAIGTITWKSFAKAFSCPLNVSSLQIALLLNLTGNNGSRDSRTNEESDFPDCPRST